MADTWRLITGLCCILCCLQSSRGVVESMTSELEGLLADFQVQSDEFTASKRRAAEREERNRAAAAAETAAAKAESQVHIVSNVQRWVPFGCLCRCHCVTLVCLPNFCIYFEIRSSTRSGNCGLIGVCVQSSLSLVSAPGGGACLRQGTARKVHR